MINSILSGSSRQVSSVTTSNVRQASSLTAAETFHNNQFKSNPMECLQDHLIDIRQVLNRGDAPMKEVLNESMKQGYFTLIPREGGNSVLTLTPVSVATVSEQTSLIHAHWIPYKSGDVEPGYVDVPKNPGNVGVDHIVFAFTAGMNGCSLDVREHPEDSNYYRVFHNQHPESQSQTGKIEAISGGHVDSLGPDEYFHPDESGAPLLPVAMNMLHFANNQWNFVSQPQAYHAHTNEPLQMPGTHATTRAVNG
ncbi:hypothetical protein ABGV49_01200 [Chromobacterium vaccinii]|uniref:Plastocyanin-like domain-containing protein n=1 Tax=Chromobacterium vaccinii TaxID=1108595 RepID=A0ABV0F6I0_9NEIS